MFFQNNKKHGACKHIVALSIIADKSEKINNIVGTDDFEVLFEDDFEEENKKEEIVKVKKEETKNENLEKDGEKKDLKRSERKSLEQKKEVSDFSDKKNNKKVGILSEIEENKKVKKEEDKEEEKPSTVKEANINGGMYSILTGEIIYGISLPHPFGLKLLY